MIHRIGRIYRDGFTGVSGELWLLAIAALINRSGTMVLPFITLYLTVERGFTTEAAGRVVGLYGVGAVMGAYLGGWLSDRIGAVRAQQASLVSGGAALLVFGRLEDRVQITVAVLFVSLLIEAFRPAVMTSCAERAKPGQKAKAFALLRLTSNLGISIGPAVGGVLAVYSYQWLFIADAVTCWLAAAFLMLVPSVKRARPMPGETVDGRRRPPWRDGPFVVLILLTVALASVLFQFFSTLPVYLHERMGFRETAVGLLLFLNGSLIVLFEMVLIHVVARRDPIRISALGAFLLCLGYGLTAYGATMWFMALTVVVWTFGEMLALPVLNAVVAERASEGYEGQYMGLYAMAFSVAFIVAPLAGTTVYDRFGPAVLWNSIGGVGILLWISFTAMRSRLGGRRESTGHFG